MNRQIRDICINLLNTCFLFYHDLLEGKISAAKEHLHAAD